MTKSYDAAGRRSIVTIAGQSNTLVYGFDAANRLTSLTQGSVAVSWGYDTANRFTGVTLPNGISSVVTPDAANEISTLVYNKGSTAIANIAYGYDGDGHVSGASGTMARPLMDAGLSSTTYDAGNHLTALATGALTYDANDNLQTQAGAGTASYTWNDRNQLTGTSNGTVLAYDALGRLVGRTQSGATTTFLYDGANQVAVNGNIMLRGANLDEVETQVTSTGTINYLTDGLGSTSMLTDSSGNVTTLYSYGAYGATASTGPSGAAATVDTPFKYTGADYNAVDDLYYFRNRYYSPHLQRFVSEDPIGLGGGINTYAYASENPITYRDPTGRCPWCVAGAVIGGVANAYNNYNAYSSGQISGFQYFEDIVVGAGTGALSGIPGLGLVGSAVLGGLTGGANEGIQELVNGNVSCKKIGLATGIGVGAAALFGPLGEAIGNSISRPVIGSLLASPNAYPAEGAFVGFVASAVTSGLPIPDLVFPEQ